MARKDLAVEYNRKKAGKVRGTISDDMDIVRFCLFVVLCAVLFGVFEERLLSWGLGRAQYNNLKAIGYIFGGAAGVVASIFLRSVYLNFKVHKARAGFYPWLLLVSGRFYG